MRVRYLDSGWEDKEEFTKKIEEMIAEMERCNYDYYDIKISSSGKHALLIFKKNKVEK